MAYTIEPAWVAISDKGKIWFEYQDSGSWKYTAGMQLDSRVQGFTQGATPESLTQYSKHGLVLDAPVVLRVANSGRILKVTPLSTEETLDEFIAR